MAYERDADLIKMGYIMELPIPQTVQDVSQQVRKLHEANVEALANACTEDGWARVLVRRQPRSG